MRKLFFSIALALSLVLFGGCDVSELSSLKEITKPYAGEYTCETLTYGGKDYLDRFERIVLTLEPEGTFTLLLEDRDGREGTCSGTYTFDEEMEKITVTLPVGTRVITRSFSYGDGEIYAGMNLNGTYLFARFAP